MVNDPLTKKNPQLRKNILLTAMSLSESGVSLNRFMDDLKYSNAEKDVIFDMLRAFRNYKEYLDSACDISKLRNMQLQLKLISYEEALSMVSCLGLKVTDKECDNHDMVGYKLPVTGDDIMRVTGLKPSKDVGDYLTKLVYLALHSPEMTKGDMEEVVVAEHRQRIRDGEYGKLAAALDNIGFANLAQKTIKQKKN